MASRAKVLIDVGDPNPKQQLVLLDEHKYIGFGGARGGGKSWVVRTKAKLLAAQYPGIKLLIVRCTYSELLNNHINPLRDELHDVARYNTSEKIFRFRNGSTLKFGYCAADKDLNQYQGAEYDVIFLDEATNLQELWIKKIMACLRGTRPKMPKRMYMTMNPGGPGHAYIKRIFIDKKYEYGEDSEDYSFIQSLVTDNKVLMEQQPDYIKQLEALPPKLREAWLMGRWDIFEGQFFEDFRETPDPTKVEDGCTVEDLLHQRRWTHVIEPFTPDRGWTIMRSYDFGYNKPFSCAWWAIDYDGVIYRILELYGCTQTPNEGVKWTPDTQFAEIARIESQHPWLKGKEITGVADPSIWDPSRGISTAEVAMKHGIYFSPGDNARIDGWMQCHYRLQFDENGYPRMYVFNNCKGFIRTIPGLMYSETKPEDLDTDGEDHIADEWRYLCMSRPIEPIKQEDVPVLFTSDPLNMLTEQRRQGKVITTQIRLGG